MTVSSPRKPTQKSLESMTGFGEHRGKLGDATLVCRARSVNHRFLDVKVRLPRADLAALDVLVRKRLAEHFKRGSIEVTVTLEVERDAQKISVNTSVAEAYATAAKKLSKKLKLKAPSLSLDALMRLPGVVDTGNGSGDVAQAAFAEAEDADTLEKIVEPALQELKSARREEGRKLAQILLKHLDEMEKHFAAICELEGPEKERARSAVIERAQETLKLLSSISAQPPTEEFQARLRDEAVFWIERRDYTEEKERLGIHLKEFRKLIQEAPDSVGRKLEFLQQEVLREINTLGTKAQSTSITSRTVEMKTILERIREQLANVE